MAGRPSITTSNDRRKRRYAVDGGKRLHSDGAVLRLLYAAIAVYDPTAFTGKFMDSPLRDQIYGFIYFSFVTLTTLGYGDITPNNIMVGTLTYMEALFGQLYVAIMIARLVGLYAVKK